VANRGPTIGERSGPRQTRPPCIGPHAPCVPTRAALTRRAYVRSASEPRPAWLEHASGARAKALHCAGSHSCPRIRGPQTGASS
jgi:hypothetical protein